MKLPKVLLIFIVTTVIISGCQTSKAPVVEVASPMAAGPKAAVPTLTPTIPVKSAGPTSEPKTIVRTLPPPEAVTPTSAPANPLVVSTQSCASASGPAPALVGPGALVAGVDIVGMIDRSLGGGVVQSKDFTLELLLYCNPAFGPLSMERYLLSDVKGLAVYYQWRYEGAAQDGSTFVFSGLVPDLNAQQEPVDALSKGQIGPAGANAWGLHFPAGKLPDLSKPTSLRYIYIVQDPAGQLSGAALSFDLQQAADGIQPGNITVTPLSDTELESLRLTLPPVSL